MASRLTPSAWRGSDAKKGLKSATASAVCVGWALDGAAAACTASSAGVELGFVEDQTENGSRFRILTLIDGEHTRESLAIHGAWSIRAIDVIIVLEAAIARYGALEHLRSDNRPEFIAYAIVAWLAQQKIKTIYITPGSPWENGHIESFHDKLRDECLNRELFGRFLRPESSWNPGAWNTTRCAPHSALGYRTPNQYARTGEPI